MPFGRHASRVPSPSGRGHGISCPPRSANQRNAPACRSGSRSNATPSELPATGLPGAASADRAGVCSAVRPGMRQAHVSHNSALLPGEPSRKEICTSAPLSGSTSTPQLSQAAIRLEGRVTLVRRRCERLLDTGDAAFEIFSDVEVPEPNHSPPSGNEFRVCALVTFHVTCDLLVPISP
jgi:hypothetical protein